MKILELRYIRNVEGIMIPFKITFNKHLKKQMKHSGVYVICVYIVTEATILKYNISSIFHLHSGLILKKRTPQIVCVKKRVVQILKSLYLTPYFYN